MDRILESDNASIGVVIGTYAAVPHVHLHLEWRRRNYPDIPILVHDDASHKAVELANLCGDYDAAFACRAKHGNHYLGDLSAFIAGLDWARERGFDFLVKFSRRFIPSKSWVQDLQHRAYVDQYATYSYICKDTNLEFRTECVAMHVPSWFDSGAVDDLKACSARGSVDGLFEHYVHNLARKVHKGNCEHNRMVERVAPRPNSVSGYGEWTMMGSSRWWRTPGVLWHTANSSEEYCAVAHSLDLTQYEPDDFSNPNQIDSVDLLYRQARQTPSDVVEHLELLARLSSLCDHVTEFGVRSGNSTAALLFGKPSTLVSYDIDPFPYERRFKRAADASNIDFRFYRRNVHAVEIDETDFLFIDDLHNYEHVETDLRLHADKVRRFIGFHDTSTFGDVGETSKEGIWRAIVEFLRHSPNWELMSHHTNNNGLTVLRRVRSNRA